MMFLFRWLALLLPLAASAADVIPLWPEGVPDLRTDAGPEKNENDRISNVHTPSLTFYRAPRPNGSAVILCPGGAYGRLAFDKEGTEMAAWFNQLGVSAFVLKYRLNEYGHPAPLRDALRAVRLVRSSALVFGIQPDRIGLVGSSAGGHLASSAGTLFDSPDGRTGHPLDQISGRPDFLVLLYPVITLSDPYAHAGSRQNLLGASPASAQIAALSTDLHVSPQTPPTFLLTTFEDTAVPAENSLFFFQALRRAHVKAELHCFQKGSHGIGMRPGFGPASDWPRLLEAWLRLNGWIP
jgi:acetyl esterase/lipase